MPSDDADRPDAGVMLRGLQVVWMGVRAEPWAFGLAVVGGAVYGAATVASGYVLGRITDRVLAPAFASHSITSGELATAVGWLAAVAVITAVGVVIRRAAAGVTMYRLQARFRRAVTRQYLRLPLSWHHMHPTGQLLSNANADVEAMWQVMAPLPMGIGVVVMVVLGVVAMFLADPVLALAGLLVVPGVIWLNALYQRRMSPRVTRAQRLRAEVSTLAHESFEAGVVVKAMGREDAESQRFAGSAGRLRDANVAVGRLRGIFDPVVEALPTLGTLAVLVVGTARVASGAAEVGDVVQVAYLLGLLAFPLRAIGWVLGELPRTVVGWERVSAVLSAGGGLSYGEAVLPPSGAAALEMEDVGYAYLSGDHRSGDTLSGHFVAADTERFPVLHGITLDVAPGRAVAVVGPTGSGKSTLASLLVRLVDPASGRVLLDGADLRSLPAGGVAGAAALVPQATFIFHDTVAENVTLGAPEPSDADVWQALRLVRADGFVRALPGGLQALLGERGTTLSGGERQRLALARAVVRRPRLLVLDDATSAVDLRVEAEILAGLRQAGRDTTVVVVAYRMATIALADEVAYIEHGRLVARGPHQRLLVTNQGYRRLVTAYQQDAAERHGTPVRSKRPVGEVTA